MNFRATFFAISMASAALGSTLAFAQGAPVNILPNTLVPAPVKPLVVPTLPPIPIPPLSASQESTLVNWLADVAAPGLARRNTDVIPALTGDALVAEALDRAR